MLKQARIFLADDQKPAIVAAMHYNAAGINYEQDEAVAITGWRESLQLVAALRSALERFSFRDRNLRDSKRSEWPAYRASGCRSIREFESSYFCISVHPANEAEIIYIAEARPLGEEEISLSVTANSRVDKEIGQRVLKLYDACSRWSSVVALTAPEPLARSS
jgi:hypothetical protein